MKIKSIKINKGKQISKRVMSGFREQCIEREIVFESGEIIWIRNYEHHRHEYYCNKETGTGMILKGNIFDIIEKAREILYGEEV